MKITVNRSSVCMGDDVDNHERTVEIDGKASCFDLLKMLQNNGFFAYVSGNNVVWVLKAGDDRCILAYYTKSDRVSLLTDKLKLAEVCKIGKLNFDYCSSPSKWRLVIESYYIDKDTSVKREVWLRECKYCDELN